MWAVNERTHMTAGSGTRCRVCEAGRGREAMTVMADVRSAEELAGVTDSARPGLLQPVATLMFAGVRRW